MIKAQMTHFIFFDIKIFEREREGELMGSSKTLAFLGMMQKVLPRKTKSFWEKFSVKKLNINNRRAR